MFGPGSQLAIAHGPSFTAQRLLAHRNAKLFPKPLRQIAQTPANNAVEIGGRPTLDGLRQGHTLLIVQPRLLTGSLAIDQPWGPRSLKRMTQSRTICRVTLPRRAASEREPPS